jgi:hypothetical protein
MNTPLTPEQEREARDLSRGHNADSAFEYRWLGMLAAALATIDALRADVDRLMESLLRSDRREDALRAEATRTDAMLDRATIKIVALEADARRWRAIWPQLCKYGRPFRTRVEAEEHADRLADEQEKTDG